MEEIDSIFAVLVKIEMLYAAIRCSFYPPTLKKGELVAGVWAFASESDIPATGKFSNFVRHKPKIFSKKQIRLEQMEKSHG